MLKKQSITIATRQSPLALWQANEVRTQLLKAWPTLSVQLLPMKTTGDRFLKDKLQVLGGKGLFVKELEEALLNHSADIAVHSMKDVPSVFPTGLGITTICKRDDPSDAFVSMKAGSFKQLPQNAVIGTASLRRQSQLLAHRPDLQIKTIRGNVGSRLEKLKKMEFDALILATSGLKRLNLSHLIREKFEIDTMLPACGQGAIGIECRLTDTLTQELLAPLHHDQDALCVYTERAVTAALGGSCHSSLAVYCELKQNILHLWGRITAKDGTVIINSQLHGPKENADVLAAQCAEALLAQGGAAYLHD